MASSKSHAIDRGPGRLERVLRECLLLGCMGLTIFLLAALFSYDVDDPGWSSSGVGNTVNNLMGLTGAWIADVLFSLIGYVAFVLPWLILLLGLHVYRNWRRSDAAMRAGEEPAADISPGLRSVALLVVVASMASLFALHIQADPAWAPQGSGGIGGQLIAELLVDVFNPVGASLILLTLLGMTLPVAAVFSWLGLLDRLGAAVLSGWAGLQGRGRRARPSVKLPRPGSASALPSRSRRHQWPNRP